jgi:type IV secretion system protein VirB10
VADAGTDSSVATQMTHLGTTIVQGTTVQALLETAINSDLPGYIRAIVRRDIRGFDGTTVLIPRGSRVIGQYRNAQSLGESRVFVIWSRLIRPDGVSVQLGSPGGDELGRGGLTGDVETHFFARFSDAIMMSVLNAGVGAATGTPQTQIAIGSSAAALGAAASASLPRTGDIPPTIKVPQGAEVTIFIARDLDFSAVKALP